VRTAARAVSIRAEFPTKVSGIEFLEGGERKTAHARAYVLSLGAIETPRLLLASAGRAHPHGIGNTHDQVGRYLMENVMCTVNVYFGDKLEAYKGPPIGARLWDFARPRTPGRGGYVLGLSGSISIFHGPLSYAENIPGFGFAHKKAMRERFGNYVAIWGMAEQEPRSVNRLLLSERQDTDGVPKVRVETALSDSDVATLEEMLGRCETLAEASGAREIVSRRTTYDRPSASHAAGTCRMGADPETSVTDPWGRVHGMENLYVADASVLVSQGAGDSPSLTIQALALRTAEHIAGALSRT
jgi:choline dehydrogenase-like flavoprotein